MKIHKVELVISAVRRSQYPTDNKPEFLLVGRSNVGKSSFINTLINRKNLARTSSNPGKTQTINFYLVNDEFYLVDAPGYGFANISQTRRKKFGLMMEDYLTNREALKQVFMLIDFRHKPSKDDKLMYEKNCIEFLTELGEFVNETKCFKYWTIKKPKWEAMLEELADCFTMLMYFYNILNIDIEISNKKSDLNILEIINETYILGTQLYNNLSKKLVNNIFLNLLLISDKLNIKETEIIEAIRKKQVVIEERLNTNY